MTAAVGKPGDEPGEPGALQAVRRTAIAVATVQRAWVRLFLIEIEVTGGVVIFIDATNAQPARTSGRCR